MGGVSARVAPATIVSVAFALPIAFVAVIVNGYDPAVGVVPEIVPEFASRDRPAGIPVAANVSGARPVTGTV
jgi:hypothetical protein